MDQIKNLSQDITFLDEESLFDTEQDVSNTEFDQDLFDNDMYLDDTEEVA